MQGQRRLLSSTGGGGFSNFDTYKFIQRLEFDGFSREKAEAIMQSLTELVTESGAALAGNSVSKAEFERVIYQSKVDVTHLRSEVSLLEKNEFSILKAEIGRLMQEAQKIPNRVQEESKRVASNVRIELSLDKARVREEQTHQELRIKEALSKIDAEVSQFKAVMETVQWELFRTLFPLLCAGGALFFSYLRFIK